MLFTVIYADPPWRYNFSKSSSRRIENHYPTMDLVDICNLPIKAITTPNAVLYLWATAPKLLQAIEVLHTWGFTYKTQAVWDKQKIGMGYWFRGQHELLLVGTKGKVSPPNPSERIGSVIGQPRCKHSEKPDCIRDAISAAFPNVNKLELFARVNSSGWFAWGNEVEDSIDWVPDI